jgi:hypothetical protein
MDLVGGFCGGWIHLASQEKFILVGHDFLLRDDVDVN